MSQLSSFVRSFSTHKAATAAAVGARRARRQRVPSGMVFDYDATGSPVPVVTGLRRKPAAAQGDVEARHTRAAPGDADHRGVADGLLPGTNNRREPRVRRALADPVAGHI